MAHFKQEKWKKTNFKKFEKSAFSAVEHYDVLNCLKLIAFQLDFNIKFNINSTFGFNVKKINKTHTR